MPHVNGEMQNKLHHVPTTSPRPSAARIRSENVSSGTLFTIRGHPRQPHQLACIREPRSRTSTLNWPRTSRCKQCVVLGLQRARRTAGQSVCTWLHRKKQM